MRNGHKPRQDQSVDLYRNPAKMSEVEAHKLASVPPYADDDEAAMQLGFDALDSLGEPDEVLIRVSTEALAGEDDLVDEGEEIEEAVEPEQVAEAEIAETAEVAGALEPDVAQAPEVFEPVEPVETEQVAEVAEAPEAFEPVEAVEPEVAEVAQVPEAFEPVEPVETEQVAEVAEVAEHIDQTEAHPDAQPDRPSPSEPVQPQPADDWSLQIRLAHIHLKTGSFVMARAELEALAARNRLDTSAHLDLAEVRWRTGDLHGAGEAALAYIGDGGDEALGFVIAAEAAALASRHADARRYVEIALQRHLSELDPVFAGLPRKATWNSGAWNSPTAASAKAPSSAPGPSNAPAEPAAIAATDPVVLPAEPEVVAREASVAAREASVAAREATVAALEITVVPQAEVEWTAAPAARPAETPESGAAETQPADAPSREPSPSATAAGAEVESGLAYLNADDPMMAALHFAVAIRLAPESANAVLDAIGDRSDLPLQLVRGDALRLLGLEGDAGKAYMSVQSALGTPKSSGPEAPFESAEPESVAQSAESSPEHAESAAAPEASAATAPPESEAPAEPDLPAEPEAGELPPIRWS